MHIYCVGLCVHGFMNPMPSWFVCVFFSLSDVLAYCVMIQAFICYCSFVRCFWRARARARVCVCVCVCVVHWHCTAQLSMFNMEKRFRNKIIIIIIITYGAGTINLFSEIISQLHLSSRSQSFPPLFDYPLHPRIRGPTPSSVIRSASSKAFICYDSRGERLIHNPDLFDLISAVSKI